MRVTLSHGPGAAGAARRPSPRLRHHGRHGPGERHRLSHPAPARCRGPGPLALGARHRRPPRTAASPPLLRALRWRPRVRHPGHRAGAARLRAPSGRLFAPGGGGLTCAERTPRCGSPSRCFGSPRPSSRAVNGTTGTPSGWPNWWPSRIGPGPVATTLAARCSAAPWAHPVDAVWMRQRSIADLKLVDDLRVGWRQLRQQAAFGLTAIGILALGMGASVTAFSVVTQLLLRPLPYPDPDRIVTLWERKADASDRGDVAPGNFLDWRDRATSFSQLRRRRALQLRLHRRRSPRGAARRAGDRRVLRRLRTAAAGRPLFPSRGAQEGREPRRRRERTAVAQPFRGRSAPGRTRPSLWTMGPTPSSGLRSDAFQPHSARAVSGQRVIWTAKAIEDHEARIRSSGYWQVAGRLAEGRTLGDAQAEMDAIAAQIEAEQPGTNKGIARRGPALPGASGRRGAVRGKCGTRA